MTTRINDKQAYSIAVNYTNLINNDPKLLYIRLEGGLYHLIIRASFLDYEFYIDSADGNILGLSTEPAEENDCQELKHAC